MPTRKNIFERTDREDEEDDLSPLSPTFLGWRHPNPKLVPEMKYEKMEYFPFNDRELFYLRRLGGKPAFLLRRLEGNKGLKSPDNEISEKEFQEKIKIILKKNERGKLISLFADIFINKVYYLNLYTPFLQLGYLQEMLVGIVPIDYKELITEIRKKVKGATLDIVSLLHNDKPYLIDVNAIADIHTWQYHSKGTSALQGDKEYMLGKVLKLYDELVGATNTETRRDYFGRLSFEYLILQAGMLIELKERMGIKETTIPKAILKIKEEQEKLRLEMEYLEKAQRDELEKGIWRDEDYEELDRLNERLHNFRLSSSIEDMDWDPKIDWNKVIKLREGEHKDDFDNPLYNTLMKGLNLLDPAVRYPDKKFAPSKGKTNKDVFTYKDYKNIYQAIYLIEKAFEKAFVKPVFFGMDIHEDLGEIGDYKGTILQHLILQGREGFSDMEDVRFIRKARHTLHKEENRVILKT